MGEQVTCGIEMIVISVFSKLSTRNIYYFCYGRRNINVVFKFPGSHSQRSTLHQSSPPAEEPQHAERASRELPWRGGGLHGLSQGPGCDTGRDPRLGLMGKNRTPGTGVGVPKCRTCSSVPGKHIREHSYVTRLGLLWGLINTRQRRKRKSESCY